MCVSSGTTLLDDVFARRVAARLHHVHQIPQRRGSQVLEQKVRLQGLENQPFVLFRLLHHHLHASEGGGTRDEAMGGKRSMERKQCL